MQEKQKKWTIHSTVPLLFEKPRLLEDKCSFVARGRVQSLCNTWPSLSVEVGPNFTDHLQAPGGGALSSLAIISSKRLRDVVVAAWFCCISVWTFWVAARFSLTAVSRRPIRVLVS